MTGGVGLAVGLPLSWSLAEEEKVDLGLDCALKESDFCVEPFGGMLARLMGY